MNKCYIVISYVTFICKKRLHDFPIDLIDCFGGKSFTTRNIKSNDYLFTFYNAWMIFVGIDIISNRFYAGVFRIFTKGFWFNAAAFCNKIFLITIKQFSQLFLIGDNCVFMNKCYIIISYETFIRKKRFLELPKALIG